MLGKSKDTIHRYLIGRYKMPIELYNNGLRYKGEENKQYDEFTKCNAIPRSKRVVCEGHPFNTIKECAEYYNINANTMRSWLNGNKTMRADFKELGLAYIKRRKSSMLNEIINYDYSTAPEDDIFNLYQDFLRKLPSAENYLDLEEHMKEIGINYAMIDDLPKNTPAKFTILSYKNHDIYIYFIPKTSKECINQCMFSSIKSNPVVVYISAFSFNSLENGAYGSAIILHELTHVVKHINGAKIHNVRKDEYATDQVMFRILEKYLSISPTVLLKEIEQANFECSDDKGVYLDRIELGLNIYNQAKLNNKVKSFK